MAWTLIILLYVGTNAAQTIVVPDLLSLQSCEALRSRITQRLRSVNFSECVGTLNNGQR